MGQAKVNNKVIQTCLTKMACLGDDTASEDAQQEAMQALNDLYGRQLIQVDIHGDLNERIYERALGHASRAVTQGLSTYLDYFLMLGLPQAMSESGVAFTLAIPCQVHTAQADALMEVSDTTALQTWVAAQFRIAADLVYVSPELIDTQTHLHGITPLLMSSAVARLGTDTQRVAFINVRQTDDMSLDMVRFFMTTIVFPSQEAGLAALQELTVQSPEAALSLPYLATLDADGTEVDAVAEVMPLAIGQAYTMHNEYAFADAANRLAAGLTRAAGEGRDTTVLGVDLGIGTYDTDPHTAPVVFAKYYNLNTGEEVDQAYICDTAYFERAIPALLNQLTEMAVTEAKVFGTPVIEAGTPVKEAVEIPLR